MTWALVIWIYGGGFVLVLVASALFRGWAHGICEPSDMAADIANALIWPLWLALIPLLRMLFELGQLIRGERARARR